MADRYVQELLSSNEKLLARSREHYFFLGRRLAFCVLLLIAVPVLIGFTPQLLAGTFFGGLPFNVGWILLPLLALPLMFGAYNSLQWYHNTYYVTSFRILHIFGIVSKESIDTALEKINDVRLQQSYWGRLLDYGTIDIYSANDDLINQLTNIKGALRFKAIFMERKHKAATVPQSLPPVARAIALVELPPPVDRVQPEASSVPLVEVDIPDNKLDLLVTDQPVPVKVSLKLQQQQIERELSRKTELLKNLKFLYREGVLSEVQYEEQRSYIVQLFFSEVISGSGSEPPSLNGLQRISLYNNNQPPLHRPKLSIAA